MKGIRFYEELLDKNRKAETSQGNVVAIFIDTGHTAYQQYTGYDYRYECLSATFFQPNSDVSIGSVSQDYLHCDCRRISEARAREIHPKLFERLDLD
jgi:hypothetical protein